MQLRRWPSKGYTEENYFNGLGNEPMRAMNFTSPTGFPSGLEKNQEKIHLTPIKEQPQEFFINDDDDVSHKSVTKSYFTDDLLSSNPVDEEQRVLIS